MAALLLAALLAGCAAGRLPGPPAGGGPEISPRPKPTDEQVILYFPHRTEPVLVQEERAVTRLGEQPEWVALRELINGPDSPEARPVELPLTTDPAKTVISAKVLEGTFFINLGRRAAGALEQEGSLLDIYAVVNTAAAAARVETVRFRIEGRDTPLMVEGVDINQPLTPRWDLVVPATEDAATSTDGEP